MIIGRNILYILIIDLCLSDIIIRVNTGMNRGCTAPMKDDLGINSKFSPNWVKDIRVFN